MKGLCLSDVRARVALLTMAAVLLALLTMAGPALAADGVPLFTSGPWADLSAGRTDIGGSVLVWESWGALPASEGWGPARIAAYDLNVQNGAPILLNDPITVGLGDQNRPSVLVQGNTVYVVWEQWTEFDTPDDRFLDTDIWIWRGTLDPATGELTADADFPKVLASGPGSAYTENPTEQSQPSIGLVQTAGDPSIVVAWADCRDTAPNVPEVYYLDLTTTPSYADPGWDAVNAGTALDPTGIMGRGQRDPSVGPKGVFWRDERYSWYDPDNPYDPTDTAIWRADFSSGSPVTGPFRTESLHQYDNFAPLADSTGAAWIRHLLSDPLDYRIWARTTTPGSPAVQLTDAVQASLGDVYYATPGGTNSYVLGAAHNDTPGLDQDVFLYSSFTHARVPICNYGSTVAHAYTYQMWPAIGNAVLGQRVVWVDSRNNIADPDNDELAQMNSRLYQAFIPRVILRINRLTVLRTLGVRLTATVDPDFTGAGEVVFQTVSGKSAFMRSTGKVTALHKSALGKGSTATWVWHPAHAGTYYVRAWFTGGQVYGPDGQTPSKYAKDAIPDVPNASQLIKVVVK